MNTGGTYQRTKETLAKMRESAKVAYARRKDLSCGKSFLPMRVGARLSDEVRESFISASIQP